jgi:hypothetical protein
MDGEESRLRGPNTPQIRPRGGLAGPQKALDVKVFGSRDTGPSDSSPAQT